MIVLDASVTLAWAFPDEANSYADAVQDAIRKRKGAIVPSLWALEVSNGLIMGESRKRITDPAVAEFVMLLKRSPIEVDQSTPALAFEEITFLAKKTGLTIYDASYLELAMRCHLPLATLDKKLKSAAQACGVEIFRP